MTALGCTQTPPDGLPPNVTGKRARSGGTLCDLTKIANQRAAPTRAGK